MGLAENGQMSEQTSDRRGDPRVTAEYRIHLVVSLHGFDADDRRFEAKGLTVNLGHRGALVRVNRAVTEGARCLMHLPDGDKRIGKTLIYGTVLRSRKLEDTFEIAIEFDTRIPSISTDAD
jgi:hypothetical protein